MADLDKLIGSRISLISQQVSILLLLLLMLLLMLFLFQ